MSRQRIIRTEAPPIRAVAPRAPILAEPSVVLWKLRLASGHDSVLPASPRSRTPGGVPEHLLDAPSLDMAVCVTGERAITLEVITSARAAYDLEPAHSQPFEDDSLFLYGDSEALFDDPSAAHELLPAPQRPSTAVLLLACAAAAAALALAVWSAI